MLPDYIPALVGIPVALILWCVYGLIERKANRTESGK
jgi:hypothetical protein